MEMNNNRGKPEGKSLINVREEIRVTLLCLALPYLLVFALNIAFAHLHI
jgi:hypothetical protein